MKLRRYWAFNVTEQPYHICFHYRSEEGIWGTVLMNRKYGPCAWQRSAIEVNDCDPTLAYILASMKLRRYWAFNVPEQPYHTCFHYRSKEGIWGVVLMNRKYGPCAWQQSAIEVNDCDPTLAYILASMKLRRYFSFNVPEQPFHTCFHYRSKEGIWGVVLLNRKYGPFAWQLIAVEVCSVAHTS